MKNTISFMITLAMVIFTLAGCTAQKTITIETDAFHDTKIIRTSDFELPEIHNNGKLSNFFAGIGAFLKYRYNSKWSDTVVLDFKKADNAGNYVSFQSIHINIDGEIKTIKFDGITDHHYSPAFPPFEIAKSISSESLSVPLSLLKQMAKADNVKFRIDFINTYSVFDFSEKTYTTIGGNVANTARGELQAFLDSIELLDEKAN